MTKQDRHRKRAERGMLLLVVVFLATAIAGLAAIISGRVVSETRQQQTLEHETRAFNAAYAQLHMALNVINTSPYNDRNQNIALRDAINGIHGGTIATEGSVQGTRVSQPGGFETGFDETTDGRAIEEGSAKESSTKTAGKLDPKSAVGDWLDHNDDPDYGFVGGTTVRVYAGRDYIKRLQRLKGQQIVDVDPFGDSDAYFVIEAAGRSAGTIRLVAALVRENEPFSSFVFFQNRATLGVSGPPRGLLHSNEKMAFYFPNGNYMDSVTAVDGFEYIAGATPENTALRDANPEANRIDLEKVDFAELKGKSDLYVGEAGLDAEIRLYKNGKVRIKPHTAPRYDKVEKSYTYEKYLGTIQVKIIVQEDVKVGTKMEEYQKKVVDYYETEYYTEIERVHIRTDSVPYQKKVIDYYDTEYYTVQEQVQTGTQQVERTRQDPVYATRTVTKYRQVKVWVPYDTSGAGGGTSVGGGAGGELGEWVWQDEPYEVEEDYISHYEEVKYWVTEPVYEMQDVQKSRQVPVYKWVTRYKNKKIYEDQEVQKERQVPVYKWVTREREVDVYEKQDVEKWVDEAQYETVTVTYTTYEFVPASFLERKNVWLGEDKSGTIYIDGRVTRLYGDLLGRLTVVGNEKVRVTGNLRYVDKEGRTAMENGGDYTKPFSRNTEYTGHSVLGVIAREDVVFTRQMPKQAEINGTLMSVNGRVGIDGFWADDTGELHKDSSSNRWKYLTEEEVLKEYAYDRYNGWKTKRYIKDSLRRIGGVISNDRVMETFIKQDSQGYAKVDSGFKRGNMLFDINLMFNPPPNFVEVPRPVVTSYVPIVLVRNND